MALCSLFSKSELIVRTAAPQLQILNAMGGAGSWVAGAKGWPSPTKGKATVMASGVKAAMRRVLTCADLCHWLVNHGISGTEKGRSLLNSYLVKKNSRSSEKIIKIFSNYKNSPKTPILGPLRRLSGLSWESSSWL